MQYLLTLSSLAAKGLVGSRGRRVKESGGAAQTAIARNPSNITAGVHGHEHGLSRSSYLSPHNISWVLDDLPA